MDHPLINCPAIFKSYIIQYCSQNDYCRSHSTNQYPIENITAMPWTDEHVKKYEEIYRKYENGGKLSEILICLQTSIQVI